MTTLSVLDAARDAPHRAALSVEGAVLTFADLAPRVNSACDWLTARGIGPGSRVALVARNDTASLVVCYALIELGATTVFLQPRLVESERAAIIEQSRPALVIADAEAALAEAHSAPPREPAVGVSDDLPLGMMFTSGTSGAPKGAVLGRSAFIAAARASAENLGWQDDDRWLLCMPLAHVGGLSIVTRCLLARRCVVMTTRFDVARFTETVERERVTLMSLVPTMLHRLFEDPAWRLPKRVRAVLLGGAATPSDLILEARRRGVPTLTTYGLTEACSQVTTQRYGTMPDTSVGSGAPVAGTKLRVVDGEIQVQGPALMNGYFNCEDQPFTDDGWLRTGDLGTIDERGHLHIDCRRSDLIVTGGENVYPAEVEAVVAALPGIVAACVFAVPDAAWGQLVAVALVPADPARPPPARDLQAGFERLLASHKRPRKYVWVAALPATATGKLRRNEARALFDGALRDVREDSGS
jgi:O-succinylbenzoic acid--CoA ligase